MFDAGGIEYKIEVETDQLLMADKQMGEFGNKAKRNFDKAGGASKKFSFNVKKSALAVGKALAGAAVGAAAIGGAVALALVAATAKIARATVELDNMARQANMTANDFKALDFAAKRYGVTGEQIADISKDISDKLSEFKIAGSGAFQDFADTMKLSKSEASKLADEFSRLSGPDVMLKMVKMMEDAGVSTKDMTFALESMGSDASKLIPLLKDNGNEARKMVGEFRKVNESSMITKEQQQSLIDLDTNMRLAGSAVEGVGNVIAAGLAPSINSMVTMFVNGVPGAIDTMRNSFAKFTNVITSDEFAQAGAVFGNQWIDAYNEIEPIIVDLWNDIKGLFTNLMSWSQDSVGTVINAIATLPENVKAIFRVISNIFSEFVSDMKAVGEFVSSMLDVDKLMNPAEWKKQFSDLKKQFKESANISANLNLKVLNSHKKLSDQQDEAGKRVVENLKNRISLEDDIIEKKNEQKQLDIESTVGSTDGLLFGTPENTGISPLGTEDESGSGSGSVIRDGKSFTSDDASGFAKGIVDRGMSRVTELEREEELLKELREESLLSEKEYQEALTAIQSQQMQERMSMVDEGFSGILTILENAGQEQSGVYKAMFALQKGFAIAQAAISLAQNVAQASAIGFPQNIPMIVGAIAQGAKISSMISGSNYQGGRRFGGAVTPGGQYEVNESGAPEIYSAGGKDFIMASENAKITPMNQMGGGGTNITVNNMAGDVTPQVKDDGNGGITIDIIRKEVERGSQGVYNKIATEFERNTGRVYGSARKGTNLTGRAMRG